MRTLLAVASVALLVGAGFGCGDDTTTTPVNDMTAVADMTIPHDMQTLSCAQILSCQRTCTTVACSVGCVSSGSSAAQTTFTTLVGCLVNACNPDAGNSAGSCAGVSDVASPSCQACLQAAGVAAAMGGTCNAEYTTCTTM